MLASTVKTGAALATGTIDIDDIEETIGFESSIPKTLREETHCLQPGHRSSSLSLSSSSSSGHFKHHHIFCQEEPPTNDAKAPSPPKKRSPSLPPSQKTNTPIDQFGEDEEEDESEIVWRGNSDHTETIHPSIAILPPSPNEEGSTRSCVEKPEDNDNGDDDSSSGNSDIFDGIDNDDGVDIDNDTIIDADSVWYQADDEGSDRTRKFCNRANDIVVATVTGIVETGPTNHSAKGSSNNNSNNKNSSRSYRRHGWIGVGVLVGLAAVAATGIAVWQHNLETKEAPNPPTTTTTKSPSLAPSYQDFPWESLGDYHESLLGIAEAHSKSSDGLLDPYSWTDPNTPQFEALSFVSYKDGSMPGGGDMGYYSSHGSGDVLLLQRLALLTLYYQTGGEFFWTVKAREQTWATPGIDECSWDGVVCDLEYRVVELDLSDTGLRGTIPTEPWVWLPRLVAVDASRNKLAGRLPSKVFWPGPHLGSSKKHLPGLTKLDLSWNEFEGSLPRDLSGGLVSLQFLDLGNNALTGPLPNVVRTELLEQLHLASNKLTGSLPLDDWVRVSSSSNSSNSSIVLALLDLENNLLSGSIPESIGDLSSLEYFSLKNNPLLQGELPPSSVVKGMTSLQTLLLSDCNLEGSLTAPLVGLLELPALKRLSMASNHLTGTLPTMQDMASSRNHSRESHDATAAAAAADFSSTLEALNLGDNAITGVIPGDLVQGRLTNLQSLQLFGNDLEGTIPERHFFRENEPTPFLSQLWLHNNPRLGGTMPCPQELAGPQLEAYDYTADCGAIDQQRSQQQQPPAVSSEPIDVECPCCRKCY